jgi:hypothetical protein
MTVSDGWDELLDELDEADEETELEWGTNVALQEGDTFTGWYLGCDTWSGDYGETPIWLFRDRDGRDVFHWGGRKQLDKKLTNASPQVGDRIAIRRLEDAPATEGRTPAWRVRVVVAPGHGTMPESATAEQPVEDDDDIPFS